MEQVRERAAQIGEMRRSMQQVEAARAREEASRRGRAEERLQDRLRRQGDRQSRGIV